MAAHATLLAAGLHPLVVSLPAGEDPDSLLRESGAGALVGLLDDAVQERLQAGLSAPAKAWAVVAVFVVLGVTFAALDDETASTVD